MPRGELRLPVYLPGTGRSWEEMAGVATIDSNGEVHIKLLDPKAADRLVEMAQERVLLQVSFDYRMSEAQVERILNKYKVSCENPLCPEKGQCGGRCDRVYEDREKRQ